jgi:hypothetical protein
MAAEANDPVETTRHARLRSSSSRVPAASKGMRHENIHALSIKLANPKVAPFLANGPSPVKAYFDYFSGRQGCSKVRPFQGRTRTVALKPEGRGSKPERRPKPEIREWLGPMGCYSAGGDSDFGLRTSDFPRSSAFGIGTDRTDFRAALPGRGRASTGPIQETAES